MNSYYQPSTAPQNTYNSEEISTKIEDLYRRRKAMEEQANHPVAQQRQQSNIFNELENEFEGLTDEQKMSIYSDEDYQKAELEFSQLMQAEIIAFIRPRLLNNDRAVRLLNDQKDTVRLLKRKFAADSQKRLDEFKEYTEKYSDLTFEEYKKVISNREVKK